MKKKKSTRNKTPRWYCLFCDKKASGTDASKFKHRRGCKALQMWVCEGCGRAAPTANLEHFNHGEGCKYIRRRIKHHSAKGKGRSLQNKIRDIFVEIGKQYRIPADDIVPKQMGGAGADVEFYGRSRRLFQFYVECKATRTGFNPHIFFEGLEKKAEGTGTAPMLFHKRDRGQVLVTMNLSSFIEYLKLSARENK